MKISNIFLDRDGTIIQDTHYLCDPDKIVFIPGAIEAMREMNQSGLNIFLVTNQSGIGRGFLSSEQYHLVQERLASMLCHQGIELTDSLFCPHKPGDKCSCRKPDPGMWTRLSETHGLSPEESVIVGDKESDILFGYNCGFKATILTLTGYGVKSLRDLGIKQKQGPWFEPGSQMPYPTAVARDIYSAWNWIKQRLIDAH